MGITVVSMFVLVLLSVIAGGGDDPPDDDVTVGERDQDAASRPESERNVDPRTGPAPAEDLDDLDLISQVEQAYDWFAEERVPIDLDYEIWTIQGEVGSINRLQILGSGLLVETGLHAGNPYSDWIAEGLCGVATANLYGTSIRRVELEASNGRRLARCSVLQ